MKDFTFENKAVKAAVYFLESGHFLFRNKADGGAVTSKTLAMPDVAAAFSGIEFDSGFIPQDVARFGRCAKGEWVLIEKAAGPADLVLDYPDGEQKIVSMLPAMVMMGLDRSYFVFAVEPGTDIRQRKVYSAPLPNLYRSGKVCFGANDVLPATPGNIGKMWDLFFQAPFSNHLVDKKSKSHPEDVREMLKAITASKGEYPLKDLNLEFNSIDEMVRRVLGGNYDN